MLEQASRLRLHSRSDCSQFRLPSLPCQPLLRRRATTAFGRDITCEPPGVAKAGSINYSSKHVVVSEPNRTTSPAAGLNAEQRAAALTDEQYVRIKAGPGSGKTRTIVARAHHLITQRGVLPSEILAITFTNKAAKELKERLAAAQPVPRVDSSSRGGNPADGSASMEALKAGDVMAVTFHGLGARIMRQVLRQFPQPGLDARFKILDTG
ncbi:hypothetical protein Agub_g8673, partial [Astrephomene gubernaculifera]